MWGNPLYYGINVENGFLVLIIIFKGNLMTSRLKEYTPDLFFNTLNEAVIFQKKKMIFMGMLFSKAENIVSEIKQLAEKDPKNRNLQIWILNHIASILQRLNRKNEALEIQKINYSLNPDDLLILIAMSEIYFKNGNFKKAKEFCEKILKKEMKNSEALKMLSQIEKLVLK